MVDGVSVLMDAQTKPFTSGQVIDYIDDRKRGTGFVIQRAGSCC